MNIRSKPLARSSGGAAETDDVAELEHQRARTWREGSKDGKLEAACATYINAVSASAAVAAMPQKAGGRTSIGSM